ncbi:hypothetical protein [Flavicella marina]|uniref:hypothetical protein n=1 Tax=Flavicella marina TaxID=1475951 RepID=UPI0012655FD8|nr:hypothetical protein [Flavicella marina]
MKKISAYGAMLVVLLMGISCSDSSELKEVVETIDPIVFNSIEVSKEMAYTDEFIELEIDATGYKEVELTSTKPDFFEYTKISNGVYHITSERAVSGTVYVSLVDEKGDYSNKKVVLSFFVHGVINNNIVDGIEVDVDRFEKLEELFGEPLRKSFSSDNNFSYWSYPDRGLSFTVSEVSKKIDNVTIYSSNYYLITDNGNVTYTDYPYTLPNGWIMNRTTMTTLINHLGAPNAKYSSEGSTLRSYRFDSLRSWIRFYSDSEDDYFGKVIKSWTIH